MSYKNRFFSNWRKCKLLFFVVVIIGIGSVVKAQSIVVSEKSSASNSFSLRNVKRIDFTAGNMKVSNKNGIDYSYALSSVRNMNFYLFDVVSGSDQARLKLENLYTTQTGNQLNVHCPFNQNSTVEFQILSIDGKLILKKSI